MNPTSTQLAAAFRGTLGSSSAGLSLLGMYGTIAAVNAGPPPSVNVYLNNNSTGAQPSTANNLSYMSDYNPVVGDAVFIVAGSSGTGMQTSYLVIGTQAGSSSGGGNNGYPIGFTASSPFAVTIPNWLLLDGHTEAAMATLYPVLYVMNGMSTTLPDWRNVSPMGAGSTVSLAATAGALTSTALIAHTHAGGSHTHAGPTHSHTDSGHSHNHNHSVGGGSSNYALYSSATDTPSGSGHFSVGGTAANTDSDNTSGSANLNNASGTTGSGSATTGSAGSGSSFSILSPVVGVNWYVKAR